MVMMMSLMNRLVPIMLPLLLKLHQLLVIVPPQEKTVLEMIVISSQKNLVSWTQKLMSLDL
jgi:hypothetical protein